MKILFLILFFLSHAEASYPSAEQFAAMEKGLERWKDVAANQGSLSDGDYMDKLGIGLLKTAERFIYMHPEKEPTHELLKGKLLSLPGHAEHFGNIIMRTYNAVVIRDENGKVTGHRHEYYPTSTAGQNNAFKILSLLPSHSTVRVLGEMLAEDYVPPAVNSVDPPSPPLDSYAAMHLAKLPFANPPTQELRTSNDVDELKDKWKDWYAEIKAGRRTFRFIGDDTEYDLRGPVRRGGSDERNRAQKRMAEIPNAEPAQAAGTERQNRFLPYALGILFLAAGLAVYFGKRKTGNG